MKKILLFLVFLMPFQMSFAQGLPDSTLQEVIIEAYAADRSADEVPASVGYISTSDLSRYSNTSVLPAVNMLPGVRMEERSPGSYRFSIRGSSVRSPFGVRNVKVYWNGLPFTDGGGNTYLNLLDLNAIGSIEVIKGPGGSLYGAGTGGVILFNAPSVKEDKLQASALIGSYGLQRYQLAGQVHSDKLNVQIRTAHQQADNYREQSEMKREAFNADLSYQFNDKNILSATLLYTDLFYETPGGLTLTQFDADASQARPTVGANLGAVDRKAAVFNNTFYGGLMHDYEWDSNWSSKTGIYGSFTNFNNPTIRNNYDQRDENNLGIRTQTKYSILGEQWRNSFTLGGEFQHFSSAINAFDNNAGVKGNPQTKDDIASNALSLFAQADIELKNGFYITLGSSFNFMKVDFERSFPQIVDAGKKFKTVFSPRIAVLKKIMESISVYGSWSRGFSPPTIAELYPSRQIFDQALNPEQGDNIEAGIKASIISEVLSLELTGYDFKLTQTIVVRRDSTGAEYFVNAGKTSQQGLEASLRWNPISHSDGLLSDFAIWGSYSYNHYRFRDYLQDVNDYSGNKFTGVPPTTANLGMDLTAKENFYLNATINFIDHIPMNDANTDFARETLLLSARAGYKFDLKSNQLEIFAGADNIFDQKYSLGNDLNAVGGRYFNTAAPRNYFAGVRLDLSFGE